MSDQYIPSADTIEIPLRASLSVALWKQVMFLDNFTCIYCGSRQSDMTVDHFIPVSLGGHDVLQNLVACCASCNGRKGARAPYECLMVPCFGRYAYVAQAFTVSAPSTSGGRGTDDAIIVGGKTIRIDRLAQALNLPESTVRRRLTQSGADQE